MLAAHRVHGGRQVRWQGRSLAVPEVIPLVIGFAGVYSRHLVAGVCVGMYFEQRAEYHALVNH